MNIENLNLDEILQEIENAKSKEEIERIRNKYLSKKGIFLSIFASFASLSKEEKVSIGARINKMKMSVEDKLKQKELSQFYEEINQRIENEKIDISLPSRKQKLGAKNPFQLVVDDITEFFLNMGYKVADGPEVELDHFNFELLNTPKDHPARDMQDSFFINQNTLLRSHTSAVQAHVMQDAKGQVPIKIICPGKVYRRDNDATHSHQFGQVEGLVIDKNISMGNLMETLTLLLRHLFGKNREVRFRPSYFPFTEPSVEVDVSCFNCNGKGCSLCKDTGWIEILGSGMVHPNVLRLNNFDDKKYQGFAFGIGIDRIAMLKYGIDDIKRIYTNNVEFLEQFAKEGE